MTVKQPHSIRLVKDTDEPITNEDMNNLILSDEADAENSGAVVGDEVQLSKKEKADADELADEISKDDTGISYEVDV